MATRARPEDRRDGEGAGDIDIESAKVLSRPEEGLWDEDAPKTMVWDVNLNRYVEDAMMPRIVKWEQEIR